MHSSRREACAEWKVNSNRELTSNHKFTMSQSTSYRESKDTPLTTRTANKEKGQPPKPIDKTIQDSKRGCRITFRRTAATIRIHYGHEWIHHIR